VIQRWFLLLALVCASCGAREAPAHPEVRNVVFVVMDTTRGDRCSVNGYGRKTTPRLEEIAREGTVFRNAWSPAGWTGPAHASMFTGLRPESHGFLRGTRLYLREDSVTLAERFQESGYKTACFSNNNTVAPEFGLAQGFDLHVPLYSVRERDYPWAPRTHQVALDWAVKARQSGAPFFLFINDMEPHYPYRPPAEAARRFLTDGTTREAEERIRELPFDGLCWHNFGVTPLGPLDLRAMSDLYDAEIACLDAAVGSLVDGLRETGLLDETVLVVVGDHGENLGDHGLVDHLFSLHRSIRHVPLVIRAPSRLPAGTAVDDVVRLEDLHPTLLELCGLPVPRDLDGASLLSDLPGRVARAALGCPDLFIDGKKQECSVPFDATAFRADLRAVYDGRHHYIRYTDGREELYDVTADPEEARNLAPAGGEILVRMRRLLPARAK
jgi:arylsulfatase A-like enzyme